MLLLLACEPAMDGNTILRQTSLATRQTTRELLPKLRSHVRDICRYTEDVPKLLQPGLCSPNRFFRVDYVEAVNLLHFAETHSNNLLVIFLLEEEEITG